MCLKKCFSLLLILVLSVLATDTSAQHSAEAKKKIFHHTGLELPRFVSLSNTEVRVRTGPGRQYPEKWTYRKKGLPVEIILEFDHWRMIRDHEGQEGWVFKNLLSGKRTGIIHGAEQISLHKKSDKTSTISMRLSPMIHVSVESCNGFMCAVSHESFSGWVEQKFIWGVYADETFD